MTVRLLCPILLQLVLPKQKFHQHMVKAVSIWEGPCMAFGFVRPLLAERGYLDAQVVQDYNANDDVHGILVQLPLPKHINEQRILDAISLDKDVDGFHPFNIGSLAMRGRQPLYTSCTPKVCATVIPALPA